MAGNTVTIALTAGQQKQIRDATGRNITELNIDVDSTGQMTEQELEKIAGGPVYMKIPPFKD